MEKKIGILGGTFDPIHIGHLIIAETARLDYGLDEIIFMPTNNPPHKNEIGITDSVHRYNMAVLATEDSPNFCVSSLELDRGGISYTIDTIKDLKKMYAEETEFYFIIGRDMVGTLNTWKAIDELFDLCYFLVAMRQVDDADNIKEQLAGFSPKEKSKIKKLNTLEINVSSTEIRDKLKRGEAIRYIVTENVAEYIKEHGLYQD
ncbi:nicotinate-nucleotide adenylyltransferase [Selenomonadales bacterium OttesenSCG-928-I06]|nr:nicotinate-nucleotide adenylyltransferase [Selenomonadales bacterium OttesenSCG-928-I06]